MRKNLLNSICLTTLLTATLNAVMYKLDETTQEQTKIRIIESLRSKAVVVKYKEDEPHNRYWYKQHFLIRHANQLPYFKSQQIPRNPNRNATRTNTPAKIKLELRNALAEYDKRQRDEL